MGFASRGFELGSRKWGGGTVQTSCRGGGRWGGRGGELPTEGRSCQRKAGIYSSCRMYQNYTRNKYVPVLLDRRMGTSVIMPRCRRSCHGRFGLSQEHSSHYYGGEALVVMKCLVEEIFPVASGYRQDEQDDRNSYRTRRLLFRRRGARPSSQTFACYATSATSAPPRNQANPESTCPQITCCPSKTCPDRSGCCDSFIHSHRCVAED